MKKRHSNQGLRKVCGCPRRTWAKCRHAWHFNFKMPHGGTSYRFSLDTHLGRHVDSKTEAEHLAAELRTAIRAGRFGQPRAAAGDDATSARLTPISTGTSPSSTRTRWRISVQGSA